MSESESKRGRPPKGSALVDGLDGSEHARERLRLILDSLAGKVSVEEACRQLDISEARFHSMRNEVLQAGLGRLEPAPAGRPPQKVEADAAALAALKEENRRLRIDLQAAHIREELAVAMPAYFAKSKKTGGAALKKTAEPKPPPSPTPPPAPNRTESRP
jgi:transposase-like protein